MANLIEAFGERKSLSAWERDERCSVTRRAIQKRIEEGMSPELAITEPRQPAQNQYSKVPLFDLDGVSRTLTDWCSEYGISVQTVHGRLSRGMSLEEALIATPGSLPRKSFKPKTGLMVEAFGERKSISDWERDERAAVSRGAIRKRLNAGWDSDIAISTPVRQYEAFGEFKTLGQWIDDERCNVTHRSTLHFRIHKLGLEPESAIVDYLEKSSSVAEKEIASFVESLGFLVEQNVRGVISKELDVFVSGENFAIEFNGLYWHSEKFKSKNYHYDKFAECQDAGIRLIQIWEDDWLMNQELVKKMIAHKFGVSSERTVYARKCMVEWDLDSATCRTFLELNHIQGDVGLSSSVGLVYEGELVALLGMRRDNDGWDLSRYATSCMVVGGFTKLLKAFRSENDGQIKTFADLCVSDGSLYVNSGFRLDKFIGPDYKYIYKGRRNHKFAFRKPRLMEMLGVSESEMTEKEMASELGLMRIYDAGKLKFVLD